MEYIVNQSSKGDNKKILKELVTKERGGNTEQAIISKGMCRIDEKSLSQLTGATLLNSKVEESIFKDFRD